MRYSYIKPRKKTIFTPEVKLVVSFFSMTIFMLLATYGFLLFQDAMFEQDMEDIKTQRANIKADIASMKEQIATIEKQQNLSSKVFTKNSVLKDSINNLFDLVPQRITLSEAKLLENGLILYGITPNKDVYNFMLQAPLRSIFHETYSSFYPAKGGWLRFVSTNYTNDKADDILNIKVEEDE